MKVFVSLLLISFLLACRQNPADDKTETNAKDTISFFQVGDYIQAEINEVNRTPYFIYKIEKQDGKLDSTAINNEVFNQLSKAFLQTDINDPSLKANYDENVFHDQTTKSYTLNYTTTNKALPVQSVDVLLNEDAQTVKRIFIRKLYDYGDSSVIEQLSWKPRQRFQVNRLTRHEDATESEKELIVVWNNKE
ncbi:hypothetical protein EXU57_22265 [Segetibacter sp. 3557_3]|uniref:hypothetical protein n=1 Tax=Segetibacter sp. 3557_3 TaxID=2547429 RepID=UPI001058B8FB|nr:hypothetical protein [Segetibacter sp. 3557_3]TDH19787.1 hypothetical protein EXU57_22265 [Segetibacter sp. 3557_3]